MASRLRRQSWVLEQLGDEGGDLSDRRQAAATTDNITRKVVIVVEVEGGKKRRKEESRSRKAGDVGSLSILEETHIFTSLELSFTYR